MGQRNCVGSGEPKADQHFILGSEPCLLAMFELSLKEERKKESREDLKILKYRGL